MKSLKWPGHPCSAIDNHFATISMNCIDFVRHQVKVHVKFCCCKWNKRQILTSFHEKWVLLTYKESFVVSKLWVSNNYELCKLNYPRDLTLNIRKSDKSLSVNDNRSMLFLEISFRLLTPTTGLSLTILSILSNDKHLPSIDIVESWQWENSLRNQSQMALPSLFKRGSDEACGWGEPFSFLSALVLVPSTSTSLVSGSPWNSTYNSRSRPRFDGFWLM